MTLPAVSRHLKVLERAGLITRSHNAQRRPRRLALEPLEAVSAWLETMRRHWSESFDRVEAYLAEIQHRESD